MNENGITRILRHKETQAFFADGGWTSRREEARQFDSTWEAIRCSTKLRLKKTSLILVFPESREVEMDVASFSPEHNSSFLVRSP